jgi:hypothetical protein
MGNTQGQKTATTGRQVLVPKVLPGSWQAVKANLFTSPKAAPHPWRDRLHAAKNGFVQEDEEVIE